MTNREFFNSIIAENATITEEMIEHAKEAIAKLDATAEKRKGKATLEVASLANLPLVATCVSPALTDLSHYEDEYRIKMYVRSPWE